MVKSVGVSVNKIEDSFDSEEKQWTPLIGEFIIHSANIEDAVFRFNQKYLKTTLVEQKNLKTNNFENQLNLFKKIYLDRFENKNCDIELLQSFLNISKRLRKTRNTIAHNSLGLVFEEQTDGQMKLVGFEIENKEKVDVSININQFQNSVEEIKECRKCLENLLDLDVQEEAAKISKLLSKND